MNFKQQKTIRYDGFYTGIIENTGYGDDATEDPDGRDRVQVRVNGIHSDTTVDDTKDGISTDYLPWAEVPAPLFGGFGDGGYGISQILDVNTHVYIVFLNGDPMKPIVVGIIKGKNDHDTDVSDTKWIMNTKSGHKITIDDTDDEQKLEIITQGGNKLILDDTKDAEQILAETTSGQIFLMDDKNKIIKLLTANEKGLIIDDDAKEIITEDSNGNKITNDNNGIIIEDKNGNTITMSSSGIEIEDKNGGTITMDSSGITLDAKGNTIELKQSKVDINGNFECGQ